MELFQNLGYSYYCGLDIGRDYKNHLFKLDLDNLYGINNSLNRDAIDKVIETIGDFGVGSFEDKNNGFMDYLQYYMMGKFRKVLGEIIMIDRYSQQHAHLNLCYLNQLECYITYQKTTFKNCN